VWGLCRVLAGGIELARVNAGWMILFIGGIVFPGSGIALAMSSLALPVGLDRHHAARHGLVFYRAAIAPPLPEACAQAGSSAGAAVADLCQWGGAFFPRVSGNPVFLGLVLAVALLVYARILRGPSLLRGALPSADARLTLPRATRRATLRCRGSWPPRWPGRRDALCGGCSLENCSQRCIASGVTRPAAGCRR